MKTQIFIITNIFLFLISCGTSVQVWNKGDIEPPYLTSIEMTAPQSIELTFHEEVHLDIEDIDISENVRAVGIQMNQKKIEIQIEPPASMGAEYQFEATVRDTAGNSVLIVDTIYGYNGTIPQMRISEFICEGSKTKGDKVEIAILSDGNLAGTTLQQGVGSDYTVRVIFPELAVRAGSYLVVHFKPFPLSNLAPETERKDQSTHEQAYDDSWDFFSDQDVGLSNTNSNLVLLKNPRGAILDAVVYSTKEDDTEHQYRGFAQSSTFLGASKLYDEGAWTGESSEILPSDTVNPMDSTTTRSISRNSLLEDTNSKHDWHITPTSGSTFGQDNTDDVYMK